MPRAITMNQRAGTMVVTGWSHPGMLAIGKIIPDSSALGIIVPTSAPSIAARCDVVRAATSTPSDSETMVNSTLSASRSSDAARETGRRKTTHAASSAESR